MQSGLHDDALAITDDGIVSLRMVPADDDQEEPHAGELNTLRALREEILEKMPDDATPKLEAELRRALAVEDYERAAELRDSLGRQRDCIHRI